MNRWLVRFDVRVPQDRYARRHWTAEAREQFLLRPDIPWPLSVDTLVWPSVFFWTHAAPVFRTYSTIAVDREARDSSHWLDVGRPRAFYETHRAQAHDGVFVAIELLSEHEEDGGYIPYTISGNIQCGIELEETVPDRPPAGSTLLGYDVADASRISGLSDCGYSEQEARDLGPVWAHRLNASGLFGTLADAAAFRGVCDERVPEHAPFWVYALWRLS